MGVTYDQHIHNTDRRVCQCRLGYPDRGCVVSEINWHEVVAALEETVRGAESTARISSREHIRMEARIVSGVAASLSNALRRGLEKGKTDG